MKLVISKVRAKSALGRGVTPTKLVVNLTTPDKAFLKGLKPGKKLYFYVNDNGSLGKAGLFKEGLDSTAYLMKGPEGFENRADALFEAKGHENLKGTRINPTYMEITRVSTDEGTARVKGMVSNAYDPVLGDRFDPSHVRALYDGSYYYIGLSPMAADIRKVVEEQKEHFSRLNDDPEAKRYLDGTANLLKPHAFEAFHKQDDLVYYVTKSGQWVALNLAGNRPLDAVDHKRLRRYMEEEGLTGKEGEQRLEQARKNFHKLPLYDRFDTKALLPLLQKELEARAAADATELERMSTYEPRYNELEPIPGLREGVEFPPHQIYLINKIKDRNRIMVDADPGCFAKGTNILMADGSTKAVEDIEVGDQVMGPDSKARNVLVLRRGRQKMYEVLPIKGNSWICNESHVLALKMTPNRDNKYQRDQLINITVKDFL